MASIRGWRRSPQLLPFLLGETHLSVLSCHVLVPSFCLPITITVFCLSYCSPVGVFLVLPEGLFSLELLPSSSEVLLRSNENFTVVSKGSFIRPIWLHSGVNRLLFFSSGVFWLEPGVVAVSSGRVGGWCCCGGSGDY